MNSRKETIDDGSSRTDDESMHGLRVALGMSSTIAVVVVVYAFAASDGAIFQGVMQYFPTLEGLDRQMQESYDAVLVVAGDMQQWTLNAFDFLYSTFF